MKKEVKYLYETLSKFIKGKESLDLIISNQNPSLNKIGLRFKSSRSHSKGFNMNKLNRHVYKWSYCDRFGHLEPFCFDKLQRSNGSNHYHTLKFTLPVIQFPHP